MQTIFEDIRNYVNVKDKLLDLYNNKFQLKEDILYFINDYCPVVYGISKIIYKRLRRIKAFCLKEKKYIYLLSLIINKNNNIMIKDKRPLIIKKIDTHMIL